MSERLLLDMDGVLADTMGGVFSRLDEMGYDHVTHADIDEYWFKGAPVEASVMLDIMREPNFFIYLDVITGAVRAVNRLRDKYDVVVCSAPMSGSPDCEEDKRDWLECYFDREFAERAIITTDKAQVLGKAIIEDNPYIEVPYEVIMFDQAWNKDRQGHRMNGWHDLKTVYEVMK